MICRACQKDITNGKAYQSKQVGMEGYYHWKCFVAQCKQTNKVGAQQIEGAAVSSSSYGNPIPGDIKTGPVEGD